jgi:sigma-B regulation protein RsbU (phosphoserine phosphatase)
MAPIHPASTSSSPCHASPRADGLATARRVQHHLFPQELSRPVGWDIAAVCRPAQVVGGDYLDLVWLGKHHLALALGDVAGKGLGSALVMAGLRALVRARLAPRRCGLADVVGELNEYLLASTPDDLFVTLLLGVLEVSTGRLRYVNAGHPPPLVLAGPGADGIRPLTEGGTVLGGLPGADFEEGRALLKPGSLLALFSDGITEATDPTGRMFHERRLVELLERVREERAARTLVRLLEGLEHFTEGKESADDISLILLRRLGWEPEGSRR